MEAELRYCIFPRRGWERIIVWHCTCHVFSTLITHHPCCFYFVGVRMWTILHSQFRTPKAVLFATLRKTAKRARKATIKRGYEAHMVKKDGYKVVISLRAPCLGDLPLAEKVVTSQFATITRPRGRLIGHVDCFWITRHSERPQITCHKPTFCY